MGFFSPNLALARLFDPGLVQEHEHEHEHEHEKE